MIQNKCLKCGRNFTRKQKQKFCCRKCADTQNKLTNMVVIGKGFPIDKLLKILSD